MIDKEEFTVIHTLHKQGHYNGRWTLCSTHSLMVEGIVL
jgi:hypothetical protein